jgi:thiol-disulfide isomerase/thioredoxin
MNTLARLFLCLALTSGALHAAASLPRTWTSKDGAAKITATFLKVEADNITLVLPNGRTQVIQKQFLSDADLAWLEQNGGGTGAADADSATPAATAKIPAALAGNLINEYGRPVDLTKDGKEVPKYYLFYYSASWCGPCLQFTPQVVSLAKQLKSASFTVILVPSDKSLKDEIAYLKTYRMPWPGLKWTGKSYPGIPGNPGGGIPAANLTDADGKILTSTAKFDRRADFLAATRKIVLGGPSDTSTATN